MIETGLLPERARGSGTASVIDARTTRPAGRRARPGSAAGRPRPVPSTSTARQLGPSARASASTTSPRPPVLAHGSHSAASIATRIDMPGIVRAAVGAMRTSGARELNRFTQPAGRYHAAAWNPSASPRSRLRRFPLPPRLEGLRRLAYNLHWAWHPRTRGLFSLIDRTAWTRYRNPIPVISGPTDWSRLLDDAKFLAEYHDVLAEFDQYMANGSDHWFQRRYADALTGPIAYFCAEYGFHESLGIYSGGLGVLAGDHMKSASDMAHAGDRRRPAVPQGLLPPDHRCRRPPGARLPRLRPDAAAARARPGRVGPAADRDRRAARSRPVRRGLGRPGRARAGPAARHGPRRERRVRPADHATSCTSAAARCGSTRSSSSGIGGVRAIRALGLAPAVWHLNEGHSAFLLAERARELVAGGQALDDAWRTRQARQRVHDPHAGLGRATSGSMPTSSGASPARCSTRANVPVERVLELGLGVDGDREPVRHDGLLAAADQRRQRGQPASTRRPPTRPGRASSTTRSWASPTASTARPGSGSRSRSCSSDLGADLDDLDARTAGRPLLGAARAHPGGDLWEAHLRQKRELAHFARGRLRSQFARHGEAPSVLAELETALDPDVLTIGFARRFATYKRAGLLFSDIDRLARMLWRRGAADPGRLRRQGPPGRPARPAGHPGDLPALALSRAARPGLHPRELRHAGRPLPRPGRRRLAQQPAPAARGVGDVGHEGRPERRPERQRPRRLVGRGVRRATTAGPSAAARPTPTRPPRTGATRRTCTGSSRRRSSRPTTTATRPACRRAGWRSCAGRWRRALWRFSTTRMLHEYTERLYLPAAGVPVAEPPTRARAVTEAG